MSSEPYYLHRENIKKGISPDIDTIKYDFKFHNKPNSILYRQHFSDVKVTRKNLIKFVDVNVGDVLPIDYSKLQLSEQSVFSTAFNEDAIITADYIYDYYNYLLTDLSSVSNITITDACSNVGGNTIKFATRFNNVNAIEHTPQEFVKLKNNIKQYHLNNVALTLGDCLKYIMTRQIDQDVIFFDPPWGGPDYKKYENLGLSLSENDITEDIDYILDNDLAKLVVLKGPSNTFIKSKKYYRSMLRFTRTKLSYYHSELKSSKDKPLFDLYFFHKTPQEKVNEYIDTLSNYKDSSDINDNKVSLSFYNDTPIRYVDIETITTDDYNVPVSVIYNYEKQEHFESIVGVIQTEDEIKELYPSFRYKNDDINNMINYSISQSTQIVSKELVRKEVFEDILQDVISLFDKLNIVVEDKFIKKMLDNYIFNKIAEKLNNDDPVIVANFSNLANKKIYNDLIYIEKQLNESLGKNKYIIIDNIQSLFYSRSVLLQTNNVVSDGWIEEGKDELIYKYTIPDFLTDEYEETNINVPIYDFMSKKLGERLIEHKYNYVACYIRYGYLDLNTVALAYDYANEQLTRDFEKDNTLECFASVFNYYYDNWCSAFGDIENVFGSLGSFWNLSTKDILKYKNLVINPPYDFNLINMVLDKVDAIIVDAGVKQIQINIIIILPNWSDMSSIRRYMSKYRYYRVKKSDTKFIDYFAGGKIIQPSDIIIFKI